MQIVVTDLTEMSANMFCVAGWNASAQRMVRPLPDGHHWSSVLIEKHGLWPGSVVTFDPSATPHASAFPHVTDDLRIDASTIAVLGLQPAWWAGSQAVPASATLQEAFQNNVQHTGTWDGALKGAYVETGVQTRSLWAVDLPTDGLSFIEGDGFQSGQLRAIFNDGSRRYNLPVKDLALIRRHRNDGLMAIAGVLPPKKRLHARVGLARESQKTPNRCVIMINGVFW